MSRTVEVFQTLEDVRQLLGAFEKAQDVSLRYFAYGIVKGSGELMPDQVGDDTNFLVTADQFVKDVKFRDLGDGRRMIEPLSSSVILVASSKLDSRSFVRGRYWAATARSTPKSEYLENKPADFLSFVERLMSLVRRKAVKRPTFPNYSKLFLPGALTIISSRRGSWNQQSDYILSE